MTRRLSSIVLVVLAVLLVVSAAQAADEVCDLSQTRCRQNNGKCNIQFKNNTGDATGSDGGTALNQTSLTQSILVRALDTKGERLGNGLTIKDGSSGTINLDKKAKEEVASIRISSKSNKMTYPISMSCGDIVKILDDNGTCQVFSGTVGGSLTGHLGYKCAGGKVSKPNSESANH